LAFRPFLTAMADDEAALATAARMAASNPPLSRRAPSVLPALLALAPQLATTHEALYALAALAFAAHARLALLPAAGSASASASNAADASGVFAERRFALPGGGGAAVAVMRGMSFGAGVNVSVELVGAEAPPSACRLELPLAPLAGSAEALARLLTPLRALALEARVETRLARPLLADDAAPAPALLLLPDELVGCVLACAGARAACALEATCRGARARANAAPLWAAFCALQGEDGRRLLEVRESARARAGAGAGAGAARPPAPAAWSAEKARFVEAVSRLRERELRSRPRMPQRRYVTVGGYTETVDVPPEPSAWEQARIALGMGALPAPLARVPFGYGAVPPLAARAPTARELARDALGGAGW